MNVKPNTLFTHDNLFVLNGMNSECVDLIYLDPPFNSKRFYSAPIGSKAAGASFKDMWTWDDVDFELLQRLNEEHPEFVQFVLSITGSHGSPMRSYITYMAQRVLEMHRILKPTGSLYLHCDPTASHYLKIMLDFIFGVENFRNEIVWHYSAGHSPSKDFKKKHDIIFRYSKNQKHSVFNQPRMPYAEKDKYRFNLTDKDGREYRINHTQDKHGTDRRFYWDVGTPCDTVWTYLRSKKFNQIGSRSKERTGYPTQKPLALLNRIIEASSNENDIVLDPVCGCATTCIAAQHLHRTWIGIDVEKKSGDLIAERLADEDVLFQDFIHRTDLPQRTDREIINLKSPRIKTELKHTLFGDQAGRCNGCQDLFDIRHFHIDHIVPRAKGGGDFRENLQLLCENCNNRKGDRPMEYFEKLIQTQRNRREIFTW